MWTNQRCTSARRRSKANATIMLSTKYNCRSEVPCEEQTREWALWSVLYFSTRMSSESAHLPGPFGFSKRWVGRVILHRPQVFGVWIDSFRKGGPKSVISSLRPLASVES